MNCEHIWPQSMYETITNNNMKSDMHHLRPCKENANSYRSNKPFNESPDNTTNNWLWLSYNYSNIPSNNISEYSENNSTIFEPREDVKGDIARAVGYKWTPEGLETLFLRSKVLLDSKAAGISFPVTGLWQDIEDIDGLKTS